MTVVIPEFAGNINIILNKRKEFSGIVSKFINVAVEIRKVIDKITEALGVESAVYIADVRRFDLLGEILHKSINPTESWFDSAKFSEAKSFIEIAERSYEQLIANENALFSEFKKDVLCIHINELQSLFKIEYDKYFSVPEGRHDSPHSGNETFCCVDRILDNRNQITKFLPQIISFCSDLSQVSGDLTKNIGIETQVTLNEAERLLELCSLISKNKKPLKSWFEQGNINKIIGYSSECENAYTEVKRLEDSILQMFEKEIISLDYNELLKRFKTEYISPLRFFKPRYYADIKSIRFYAKNPHTKLSVGYIIDLLQKVKTLHENKQWIINNSSKMAEAFGLWFNDDFTNWNEVKKSLKATKDIVDYFNGDVPTKLITLLIEFGATFQKVCIDTKQLQSLIEKSEIIDFYHEWMPSTEESKNNQVRISEISTWAKRALELSCNLFSGYDEIKKYLIDPERRLFNRDIIVCLNQIECITKIMSWISENERFIVDFIGDWHDGRSTDWESIKLAIIYFESLKEFFGGDNCIPDKLHSILLNKSEKLPLLRNDFISLSSALQQWEEATHEYTRIARGLHADSRLLDNIISDACELREAAVTIFDTFDCVTSYLKSNIEVTFSDVLIDMGIINSINDVTNDIDIKSKELVEKYSIYFNNLETDWDMIAQLLNWVKLMKTSLGEDNCSDQFINLVCTSKDITKTLKEISFIEGLFDSKKFDFYSEDITKICYWLNECVFDFKKLEDWIDFRTSKEQCINNGLSGFVEEVYKNNVKSKDIVGAFMKRFYKLWLNHTYAQCPTMMSFRGVRHEDVIKLFRVLDKEQFKIAQSRIRELLSSKRPNPNAMTSRGSEVSILQRELSKKRKIMPLRKLFIRIPNMLFALKPCLLMSPLSVSLFLDPDYYKFDVVIFDEASQICTEDAIGAIFRAEQCIIVGDKEQLPPTNFFNTSTGDTDFDNDKDDEEDDDTDAYESILDECSTALNKLTLQWHYRSRHEHLITFSNAKIYRNLITFPSSLDKKDDFGVEYIEVKNGIYDRSGTRTNKIEAQRVAQLVFEHFKKYPNRSLGVVAFSEAQQNAIDAEVRKLRLDNPFRFEQYFNEENHEPFFIKNLENVQGDERDTIIFSIGYAKDQNGTMHMNFGPLSKQGGYRRLNVAITRARDNVKLVGSIKPTDIDLDRTSSQGVKMLRQYIDFAINGPKALEDELSVPGFEEFDSPFEEEVYRLLCDRGYRVDTQVGCSGYRIDMAVRHPELSGIYTIGIECDGATYHSARTARERDRLREEVLRARGWNIHRIWSTDWVKNPKSEVERLIKAVEDSILSVNCEKEASQINSEFMQKSKLQESNDDTQNDYKNIETVITPKSCFDTDYKFDEYEITDIYSVKRSFASTDMQYVADVLNHIVKIEGPIHFDVLSRRIAPLFGKERAGAQIKRYIDHVLQKQCYGKIIKKGDFCWSSDMDCPKVRKPVYGDSPRNIEHICVEEIAEAMLAIIMQSVGLDWSILLTETARVFGFNRTGGKIQDAMMIALDYLVSKNRVVINNDSVSIA
jgi:very-short-patch-repair endonuclease